MAFIFKLLLAVTLVSKLCVIYSTLIGQVPAQSRILRVNILNTEDYDNDPSLRVKKDVIKDGKCPKGMMYYAYLCWTLKQYKELKEEVDDDYGPDTTTDFVTVTTVVLDEEYTATSIKYRKLNTVSIQDDKSMKTITTLTDLVTSTESSDFNMSNTKQYLRNATASNVNENDNNALDTKYKIIIAVVVIGSCLGILTWLLRIL